MRRWSRRIGRLIRIGVLSFAACCAHVVAVAERINAISVSDVAGWNYPERAVGPGGSNCEHEGANCPADQTPASRSTAVLVGHFGGWTKPAGQAIVRVVAGVRGPGPDFSGNIRVIVTSRPGQPFQTANASSGCGQRGAWDITSLEPQWGWTQQKINALDIGVRRNSATSPAYSLFIDNFFIDIDLAPDADNDGVPDANDNCPNTNSQNFNDTDGDGRGDICDNCPSTNSHNFNDSDGDGHGDICDNCPSTNSQNFNDADGDGRGDVCDNCPNTNSQNFNDYDGDGRGDVCDIDCPDGTNDCCANATLILDAEDNPQFSTAGYTTDGPVESCGPILADAWFRVRPSCDGWLHFGVGFVAQSLRVAFYRAPRNGCYAEATLLNCYSLPPTPNYYYVLWPQSASSAFDYLVRIGTADGSAAAGRTSFSYDFPDQYPSALCPRNDQCANAIPIGEGDYDANSIAARQDGSASCGGTRDVWLRYVAPRHGETRITACDEFGLGSVEVAAFAGCGGAELACARRPICGEDGIHGGNGVIQFPSTAGAEYRIRLASDNGETQRFEGSIVTVPYAAPTITEQPLSAWRCLEKRVTFRAAATGVPLPSASQYQWFHDSGVIAGATGPVLTISSIHPGDAGAYVCRVATMSGQATTAAAYLSINQGCRTGGLVLSAIAQTATSTFPGLSDVALNRTDLLSQRADLAGIRQRAVGVPPASEGFIDVFGYSLSATLTRSSHRIGIDPKMIAPDPLGFAVATRDGVHRLFRAGGTFNTTFNLAQPALVDGEQFAVLREDVVSTQNLRIVDTVGIGPNPSRTGNLLASRLGDGSGSTCNGGPPQTQTVLVQTTLPDSVRTVAAVNTQPDGGANPEPQDLFMLSPADGGAIRYLHNPIQTQSSGGCSSEFVDDCQPPGSGCPWYAGAILPLGDASRAAPPDLRSLLAADVNGDEFDDLVFTDAANDEVGIRWGPQFTSGPLLAVGRGPVAACVADFDGNGSMDVCTADFLGRSLTLWHGQGAGAFAQRFTLPVPVNAQPQAVAAGDIDGDGRVDLAAGLVGAFTVGVWINGADSLNFDCDGDMVRDSVELLLGTASDANGNGFVDGCEAPSTPGDMNCDSGITVSDISGFVLALTDPAAYSARFPLCSRLNADVNADGRVTVSDIGPFVQRVLDQG